MTTETLTVEEIDARLLRLIEKQIEACGDSGRAAPITSDSAKALQTLIEAFAYWRAVGA